jgi:hypothetical protein
LTFWTKAVQTSGGLNCHHRVCLKRGVRLLRFKRGADVIHPLRRPPPPTLGLGGFRGRQLANQNQTDNATFPRRNFICPHLPQDLSCLSSPKRGRAAGRSVQPENSERCGPNPLTNACLQSVCCRRESQGNVKPCRGKVGVRMASLELSSPLRWHVTRVAAIYRRLDCRTLWTIPFRIDLGPRAVPLG